MVQVGPPQHPATVFWETDTRGECCEIEFNLVPQRGSSIREG
jgi:hypothetical protein